MLRGNSLMLKRVLWFGCLMLTPALCWGQGPATAGQRPLDLTSLSLEALMDVRVTSAAKKEQIVAESAAALFVITQEDIQRSGATTVAEALRMVPGLDVARIDAHKWAISARGFNSRFADKMLVLVDGRSVYTPIFSGVFWDVQDLLLEDVDRIEVIRGPGATLWGANAVNGVINVITKDARLTQGGLVSAGGGSKERGFGAVRYGGTLGQSAGYRVWAKYFDRADFLSTTGGSAQDGWDVLRGGFRIDADMARRAVTVEGAFHDGDGGGGFVTMPSLRPPFTETLLSDTTMSGSHLLGRWRQSVGAASDMTLQLYYDRTKRRDAALYQEVRDTLDVDFQHRLPLNARQELIWGAGYNFTTDDIVGRHRFVAFSPASRGASLTSAFAQHDLSITPRVRLMLGSKVERNDYTGFEWQPNVRLLWRPDARQTLWGAVSRAVRTPARIDHDARVGLLAMEVAPNQIALTPFVGNPDFRSERLVAYEVGYRAQPFARFSLDGALFYNAYADLRTAEPGAPSFEPSPPPPHLVIPVLPFNMMDGTTYGGELATIWTVTPRWKISSGYSFLRMDLQTRAASLATTAENAEGNSPRHQFNLRCYLDLPFALGFDSTFYYVGALPNLNVPDYGRVDTRLAWYPVRQLELSLVLQNLLDDRHVESGPGFLVTPTIIERSAYGKVTWRF